MSPVSHFLLSFLSKRIRPSDHGDLVVLRADAVRFGRISCSLSRPNQWNTLPCTLHSSQHGDLISEVLRYGRWFSLTRAIPEHFRDKQLMIKC